MSCTWSLSARFLYFSTLDFMSWIACFIVAIVVFVFVRSDDVRRRIILVREEHRVRVAGDAVHAMRHVRHTIHHIPQDLLQSS